MLRVAFQGDRGAYGEEAIAALWGAHAEPWPVRTFADVVALVERGAADAGVLPVENSVVGTVHEGVRALASGGHLSVLGVTTVPVRHCLLGVAGASLADVRRVESHPVALAQCRAFLARHPHIAACEAFDTAGAAREVARVGDVRRAAIAGRAAAARYGLTVLASDVADAADNRTRFVAVGRAEGA
jgi:prephenate dehydratase